MIAAPVGAEIGETSEDVDQECANPEDGTARAEGDIVCHECGPRLGWMVEREEGLSWPHGRSCVCGEVLRNGLLGRAERRFLEEEVSVESK